MNSEAVIFDTLIVQSSSFGPKVFEISVLKRLSAVVYD